jgi:hypothetical protein
MTRQKANTNEKEEPENEEDKKDNDKKITVEDRKNPSKNL